MYACMDMKAEVTVGTECDVSAEKLFGVEEYVRQFAIFLAGLSSTNRALPVFTSRQEWETEIKQGDI